jgi:uncharacterized protein (TIGR02466 family)
MSLNLDIDLGNNSYLIYGTPVFRQTLPDAGPLCDAVTRVVLEHAAAHPEFRTGKRNRSNQGGWRSEPDLFRWPEPEIAALRDIIVQKLLGVMQLAVAGNPDKYVEADLALAGWVNVNTDGDYNVIHGHAGNHWSGAFYPCIGEPDPTVEFNGAFEFCDPRSVTLMASIPGFNFGHGMPIQPEPGMLLIFPSFMQHFVHPFRGAGTRISMAFNARVQRLDVKDRNSA